MAPDWYHRNCMWWRNASSRTLVVCAFVGVITIADLRSFPNASEREREDPRSGEVIGHRDDVILNVPGCKFRFRYVPPGTFTMGSPVEEDGREGAEGPARIVEITKGFYLGKYEVTREQYAAVMGGKRLPLGEKDIPHHGMRFADALLFCEKMSKMTDREVSLPTEAQWEYACRAGSQTRFYTGNSESDLRKAAWYRGNSDDEPHPVGAKVANAFGLYDMHGNVAEFCIDSPITNDYGRLPAADPIGNLSKFGGALRGGNWQWGANRCRSAARSRSSGLHDGFTSVAGMRLVVTLNSDDDQQRRNNRKRE